MVYFLVQYLQLVMNSCQVISNIDSAFLQYFDSNFMPWRHVNTFFHFTKSALTDSFPYQKIAYFFTSCFHLYYTCHLPDRNPASLITLNLLLLNLNIIILTKLAIDLTFFTIWGELNHAQKYLITWLKDHSISLNYRCIFTVLLYIKMTNNLANQNLRLLQAVHC